jgi:hypothetical protein
MTRDRQRRAGRRPARRLQGPHRDRAGHGVRRRSSWGWRSSSPVETISRKLFNVSLQGADELGGYALAVGSTLAFSLSLLGRNHIRVDVFHDKFPPRVQALLNWLSIVSLAVFALFIAWVAFKVIQDTTPTAAPRRRPGPRR